MKKSILSLSRVLLLLFLCMSTSGAHQAGGNEENKKGAENRLNTKNEDKDSLTFVQITDSHVFDSGKPRHPQQPMPDLVEMADSRQAWDWALLEINRLATAGKLDFVVFTGDFGLEKVTTGPPKPGCISKASAVDDVVRSFRNLLVDKVYVLRGNNDLADEGPQDAGRFDDFVAEVDKELGALRQLKTVNAAGLTVPLVNVTVLNLTPALGNNIAAVASLKGIRLIGLDSSSFKKDLDEHAQPNSSAQTSAPIAPANAPDCPYNAPVVPANIIRAYQSNEIDRVSQLVDDAKGPVILFTHVPDLDDPKQLTKAWGIALSTRQKGEGIIADPRVLAMFAGHLHDSIRSHYLPPYSWQVDRKVRPEVVYEKTYLSPPLAAKFQMDKAPQARGYLLATVTPQGVQRAEIRWYSAGSCDVIVAPKDDAARTHRRRCWKWIALYIALGVAALLLLMFFWLLLTRRVDAGTLAKSEGGSQFALVLGSALLSLLLIAIAKALLGIGESGTLIALMLIPLLVYGVVSGRLKGLKAPGGWEATFQEVGARKVDVESVATEIEASKPVEKRGVTETMAEFEGIQPGKPVVMTLKLGTTQQAAQYDANALQEVVDKASRHAEFRFVVVLDEFGRLVSYIPVNRLKSEMQQNTAVMLGLVNAVNSGDIEGVRAIPEMRMETVSKTTSNAEALALMQELRLNAILAVDVNYRPIGVVERQQIINQIVAQLAKHAHE